MVPIDRRGIGGVEDSSYVRLDGDPTLVAGLVRVREDLAKLCLTLAGHGVIGFHIGRDGVHTVLDVDVGDVLLHFQPEIQRILPWERLGL